MKKLNNYDKVRYKGMGKLINSNKDKIIVDIGGGLYSIAKKFESKQTIIVDGDSSFEPDILMNLNNPLPLENDYADIVIAGEILEHLINPFKFLLEIKRILKPNGELILSVPNIVCLKGRIQALLGKLPANCAQAYPTVKDHLFHHKADYNWKRLKEMIETADFKITHKQSIGIFIKNRLIIPPKCCPLTLGEKFIIKAVK